jgi:hypothetical protein
VVGLVANLAVGEPQRHQAGRCVRLVAQAVAGLLGWRPVVPEPVGLDDQAQLGLVEVDLETIQPHGGLRRSEPSSPRDGQRSPLELRVGEDERTPVE